MCSIGKFLNEVISCAGDVHNKFTGEDMFLLRLRTGCLSIDNVCVNHSLTFLKLYSSKQKCCCNPFSSHKDAVKSRLQEVSLEHYHKWKNNPEIQKSIVPGTVICDRCSARLNKFKDTPQAELQPGGHSGVNEQPQPAAPPEPLEDLPGSSGLQNHPEGYAPKQTEGSPLPTGESQSSTALSSDSDTMLSRNNTPFRSPADIVSVNKSLAVIGVSPVTSKRLGQKRFPGKKLNQIKTVFAKKFSKVADVDLEVCEEESEESQLYEEMIDQLKDAFTKAESKEKKIHILSVLPDSWTIQRMMDEMNCSNYMGRQVKHLMAEQGILPSVNPNLGHPFDKVVVETVINFYKSEEISKTMPGAKDFVSVKIDGKREHKQKRLMLCNLDEAHALFKVKYPANEYPALKISFSKFADLRPAECILAGAAGTHSVCVCKIHQNTILMASAVGLEKKRKEPSDPPEDLNAGKLTFDKCVSLVMCSKPQETCYLRTCKDCPDTTNLTEHLQIHLDEYYVENVTYKQWISVDRCTLTTVIESTEEFINKFCEALPDYITHNYIAKEQARFLDTTKANLKVGEVVMIVDFSENFAFMIQEAIQSYHWDKGSATVHPFVAYYRSSEGGDLQCFSYCVISDYLKHNSIAFHAFLQNLMPSLKEKVPNLSKIMYFSDGAASQYKNLYNVSNLLHHVADTGGVHAEWHYFATSHGRGPCDAAGGTLKRKARKASLQHTQITTPTEFYNWAKQDKTFDKLSFGYVSTEEVTALETKLADRMKAARPVPDIQKTHAIIPVSQKGANTKRFSSSSSSKTVDLSEKKSSKRKRNESDADNLPKEV